MSFLFFAHTLPGPRELSGGRKRSSSVQFSHSVVSNSLRPHELQHARPPCPSTITGVHSDSHPSSQWCHPATSSSVVPFSFCPQSIPASESFPMSQLFAWGGWMASLTWWTWVWVNSGSWWWTGRPGVLWFMGLQGVRHDWVTELNWTETLYKITVRTNEFMKFAGYKISLQKSVPFLYTISELFERESKKTIPLTTALKRTKYLEIHYRDERLANWKLAK